MSWKKNAISYIMWFLYVLLTEALVLTCADELGQKFGLSVYESALLAFAYAALVGLFVLFVRKICKKFFVEINKHTILVLVLEAVVCIILLAIGLMLRISNMETMAQDAAYFESAKVTYGQSIPQVVHGAVYLYLQVLHGLFWLVGNHFVAGIWLQIVLQMLAFVILYFAIRKMSGAIAALITLGFGMCAPMMGEDALVLSPEVLYLLLVVLVIAVYMMGCGRKLYPALYLLFGGLAAVMTYLDITGIFLFLFAAAMPFCIHEMRAEVGRKMAALTCTVVSYVGVFVGTIFLDAIFSGKIFGNVLKAWTELYSVKAYEATNTPFAVEEIVMLGLLVVGIFSFWCDKQREVISVSMCSLIGFILLSVRYTEEIPMDLYLILSFVVMAGTFVGQVFTFRTEVSDAADACMTMNVDVEVPGAAVEVQVDEMVTEEQSAPAIQFIENPLPLPKKHEKRVLDYAVDLTEETAEFDFDVADDDDYDK